MAPITTSAAISANTGFHVTVKFLMPNYFENLNFSIRITSHKFQKKIGKFEFKSARTNTTMAQLVSNGRALSLYNVCTGKNPHDFRPLSRGHVLDYVNNGVHSDVWVVFDQSANRYNTV